MATASSGVAPTGAFGSNHSLGNDIIYKMSKKLAQLTKIVYFLNTKNEDHSAELASLTDAYEFEISQLLTEANQRIQEYKVRYEKGASDSEKKLANEYEEFRKQAHHKQEELENSLRMQAESLNREAEETKATFQDKLNGLVYQNQKLQEDSEEKDRIINELKQKIDHSEKSIGEVKLASEQSLAKTLEEQAAIAAKSEESLQSLEEQLAAKKEAIQGLQSQLQEAVELQLKDARAMEELQDKCRLLEESDTSKAQKVSELEAMYLELKRNSENEKMETAIQIQHQEEQLVELLPYKSKFEDLVRNFQQVQQDLVIKVHIIEMREKEVRDMQAAGNGMKALIADLNRRVDALTRGTKDLSEKNAILTKDLAEKIDVVKDLNVVIDGLRIDHKAEIDSLNASCEERIASLIEEDDKKLQNMMEERDREFQSALAEQKESYESKIILIHEDYQRQISDKLKEIDELNASHADNIGSMKKEIDKFLGKISKLQTQTSHLEDEKNQLRGELDDLKTRHSALTTRADGLQSDKEQLKRELSDGEKSHKAELAEKLEKLKNQMNKEWNDRLALELTNLRGMLDTQHTDHLNQALADAQVAHQAHVDELNDEHQREAFNLSQELKRVNFALDQTKESVEERLKEIEALKKAHSDELKVLNARHSDAMRKTMEACKQEIEKLNELHAAELMSKLKIQEEEYNKEMAKLRQNQIMEIEKLKSWHALDKETALDIKAREFSNQSNEMQQNYLGMMEQLRVKLQAEKDSTLKDWEVRKQDQIDYIGREWKGKLDAKQTELTLVEKKNKDLETHRHDLKKAKEELEMSLLKKQRELDYKCMEMEETRNALEARLRERESTLMGQHRDSTERLISEHVKEKQKMLTDFTQVQIFLKSQIAMYEKKLKDADEKYINREPRDVDLQTIQDLEEELKKRKLKIHALMDELKRFQLEIANREDNFNRMFNVKQNIGILKPQDYQKKAMGKNTNQRRAHIASMAMGKLPPLFGSQHISVPDLSALHVARSSPSPPQNVSSPLLSAYPHNVSEALAINNRNTEPYVETMEYVRPASRHNQFLDEIVKTT